MVKENVSTMSDEHVEWLNALGFYKQELNTIKNRLTEIAGKNTNKQLGTEIEHYENQVNIQIRNIGDLRHDIKGNLANAAIQAKNNLAGYIDAEILRNHERQKETFISEERIINELRQDFNRFASQWM